VQQHKAVIEILLQFSSCRFGKTLVCTPYNSDIVRKTLQRPLI